MRPTELNLRSPKERTPGHIYEIYQTNTGGRLFQQTQRNGSNFSVSRNGSKMSMYNTSNHQNFGTTPRFKYIQMIDRFKGTQPNVGPGKYESTSSLDKVEKKEPCSVVMRQLLRTRGDNQPNYQYHGNTILYHPEGIRQNSIQRNSSSKGSRQNLYMKEQNFMCRRVLNYSREPSLEVNEDISTSANKADASSSIANDNQRHLAQHTYSSAKHQQNILSILPQLNQTIDYQHHHQASSFFDSNESKLPLDEIRERKIKRIRHARMQSDKHEMDNYEYTSRETQQNTARVAFSGRGYTNFRKFVDRSHAKMAMIGNSIGRVKEIYTPSAINNPRNGGGRSNKRASHNK